MTGSYDRGLNLLYWGIGNPGPDYQGDVRPGLNLYSNSVVALDPETGRMRWYFQFTPHDEHDRDATEILVLADLPIGGRERKVLLQANRNGFYYVLDRETGEFVSAKAFVRQDWAEGIDSAGRPKVRAGSRPTPGGTVTYPGDAGGTNWWSPSFVPGTATMLVPVVERAGIYFNANNPMRSDGPYEGSAGESPPDLPWYTAIRALAASSGDLRWEFRIPAELRWRALGGVLSTAGGVAFFGSSSYFFALDARTGTELWRTNFGGIINAAPISYLSEGRQQVTIAAGRTIVTLSLDGR
jgi:alcohol dehydrogenase (cytochrome c)